MNITFLRHGSLLPPFDDYSSLSLNELTRLARQEVDPSIDPSKTHKRFSDLDFLEKKYDALFVSYSRRTHETANELSKKLDLSRPIELKELSEVLFDPSQLVTEQEYKEKKLTIIRERLFESLAKDSNIEPGKKVAERLMSLDRILHLSDAGSALVITHGFFMRYLDIFYRQKSRNFNEEALNQAVNYEYASGFTITL